MTAIIFIAKTTGVVINSGRVQEDLELYFVLCFICKFKWKFQSTGQFVIQYAALKNPNKCMCVHKTV